VVATGGLAALVAREFSTIEECDELLTLRGLRHSLQSATMSSDRRIPATPARFLRQALSPPWPGWWRRDPAKLMRRRQGAVRPAELLVAILPTVLRTQSQWFARLPEAAPAQFP